MCTGGTPSRNKFAGYAYVDVLGAWYKSVNFGAERSPGSPDCWAQNGLRKREATLIHIRQTQTRTPQLVRAGGASEFHGALVGGVDEGG